MTENLQHDPADMHPPRVRITYDLETGGAIEKKELPFVVGILADLSGDRADPDAFPALKERRMVEIDRNNFNSFMQTVAPRVDLQPVLQALPDLQASADPCDKAIVFHALEDFEPLRVANALPALRAKLDARSRLRALQAEGASGDGSDIDAQVVALDRQLNSALSAILHAPAFQAVEAAWRGLHYLVARTRTGGLLRLRVFNAAKDELRRDLEKAVAFDQSVLFKLIHEAEYGTYGGFPYGLLVGGFDIDGSDQDIGFLKKMSEVAAAAHAPFIAAASCELFSLSGFDQLDKPRMLSKIFESEERTAWREFRATDDARYVSLVLPRVLLRLPYGRPAQRNAAACEGLDFEELLSDMKVAPVPEDYPAPNHACFLWGNAAYVLAERITHAFALNGWPAAIRGVERGGLVEGLPLHTYAADAVTTALLCPTEVSITDRRERELRELGFIALCHCKGTDQAAFFSSHSTHASKKYFDEEASDNSRVSATLPCLLAASRFAHYIKVIMREKLGGFLTRANVESYLNSWIAQYVLLDDMAPSEAKAAYPLRSANIVVTETQDAPGCYRATIFLQPHFQLEEITTSIRLITNLPA